MVIEAEPDWFYHYTTAEGLLGILESKSIWHTNANFLNDHKELQVGISYARDWYDANKNLIGHKLGEDNSKLLSINLCSEAGKQSGPKAYVCSFSEARDSLSQWRAYGKGGGYKIGFHREYLTRKLPALSLRFEKCIYEHDDVNNPVSNFLKKWIEQDDIKTDSDHRWLDHLLHQIVFKSLLLKGNGFAEEKEWRMFYDYRLNPEKNYAEFIRVRGGVYIPYIACEVFPGSEDEAYIRTSSNSTSPVLSIMSGPAPDPELTRIGLLQLLRKCQYHFLGEGTSMVTYRNW